jgi:broad specificity phosphatase PhoE
MKNRILVMRHAEKPDDPLDPHLSAAGRQRAKSLPQFILNKFGKPDFVFASMVSAHSSRPVETVDVLSRAIGITVDTTYADQDYGALAHDLKTESRFVDHLILVCWHHGNIPNMMHALGAPDQQYPDPWPRTTFNLILQMDENGTPHVTTILEPF